MYRPAALFSASVSVALALLACSSDSSAPDNDDDTGSGERHIAIHAGNAQAGVMGQPTPVLPQVMVTDDDGDPVAGVVVTFTVASGGGSLSTSASSSNSTSTSTSTSTSVFTSASGLASAPWTLGNTFAPQTLDATADGIGSVTFLANAIGPDDGILAFNSTDPTGDTASYSGFPVPRALDLTAIRGDFKRDSLILTLTFSGPVSSAALGGDDGLFGFIEFDIDDDVATGANPESAAYGATANLGIDFLLDLFDEDGLRTSVVHSFTTTDAVPSTFSGNTAIVRIPMRLLGNDDGNFSIVGTLGLIDRATDVLPNSEAIIVRP
jgi:hypothetical protein